MTSKSKINNTQASTLFNSFRTNLRHIIESENIASFLPPNSDGEYLEPLLDTLISNYIHVGNFVRSVEMDTILPLLAEHPGLGKKSGKRLIIAPCSPLFTPILENLVKRFENLVFLDLNRSGLNIGNHTIQKPSDLIPHKDDMCLIMTRNTEAITSYQNQFDAENCINLLEQYIYREREHLSEKTQSFIEEMDQAEQVLLFASARPMGTMTSTIHQLTQKNIQTFWLGAEEIKDDSQTGYSTPKTSDMGFSDYFIGGLLDMLYVFTNMAHGTALFHFEALYPPAWDFERIAVCYAGTLALLRTVKAHRKVNSKATLALYMYDAIKPGVKNFHAGEACGRLYKTMMREAEALVFSSYTEKFGDFVENSIGKKLARCHCHRYQVLPERRKKRLQNGFHIAIISVLLEEFWEPSRVGLIPYIQNILAQGIYIHYYVGQSSRDYILKFKENLDQGLRPFFQIHSPIHDPEKLAHELSQYHVGWSLFNMQIFCDMTSKLTDQFTRDAMEMFTPTTLPSVIWSCAAAGLPVICNRSMRGVSDMLPEGMSIPLTLSELGHLKEILKKINWDKIDKIPLDNLDISSQIYKLDHFLESLRKQQNHHFQGYTHES
jgi:hypothetical protein